MLLPAGTNRKAEGPQEHKTQDLDQVGRLAKQGSGSIYDINHSRHAQRKRERRRKRHHSVGTIWPPGHKEESQAKRHGESGPMALEMDCCP